MMRLLITAAVVTLVCLTAPVLAQENIPKAPDQDKPWLVIAIAAVLVVGALVASFKPSKRGHQD